MSSSKSNNVCHIGRRVVKQGSRSPVHQAGLDTCSNTCSKYATGTLNSNNSSAYCLRPRNQSGQVASKSSEAHEVSLPSNTQLVSRCREVKVMMEDISHLCEAVEPSEADSQVSNHSADPLLARDRSYLNSLPERSEIAWPSMNDGLAWKALEESVMRQLPMASHGLSVGARLQCLESTVYDCASAAFGHKLPSSKQAVSHFMDNKRKVIKLVQTKNELTTQIRLCCSPQEQMGIGALLEQTKLELRALRRKERRRMNFLRKQQRRRLLPISAEKTS